MDGVEQLSERGGGRKKLLVEGYLILLRTITFVFTHSRFRMKEFHRNHTEISQDSVHHRKNTQVNFLAIQAYP
jgi:hypothetical protein